METNGMSADRPGIAFALIASSTVLGLAGTDLVLPAIPTLANFLAGGAEKAQLVLAAFTAGLAAGLLLFGELGARYDQRRVLVGSLLAYSAFSVLCRYSNTIDGLVPLRFLQGMSGAAAATFAPGMLRVLYGDERAVRAIGLLGSIEAMAPALAPLLGLWLIALNGWQATFDAIAVFAALLAIVVWLRRADLPRLVATKGAGSYRPLLSNKKFLRQTFGQALTLGALLAFVFGAPTVFVTVLGRTLTDFIIMQAVGIIAFATAANVTGRLIARVGAERLIVGGTIVMAAGMTAILAYACLGGANTLVVTGMYVVANLGFGLRGPPGFHAAIVAADDDTRGAALLTVVILLTAALATAAVAPFILSGLVSIAAAGAILSTAAALIVAWRAGNTRTVD